MHLTLSGQIAAPMPPTIAAGKRSDAIATGIDFLPTFCVLAGVHQKCAGTVPSALDKRSPARLQATAAADAIDVVEAGLGRVQF
jgi:arylsulfatase A-like enzyme